MTHIFIRNKGDIVGYAKHFCFGDNGTPSRSIHGHALSTFAKKGENLVAIYSVQIFVEFEEREYPYRFKSFEDLPVLLGDLNDVEKAFKQVIAWDSNKIVPNPLHAVEPLDVAPRTVSVETISAVRDTLQPSPSKVHFSPKLTTSHPLDLQRFRSVTKELYSQGKRTVLPSLSGPVSHYEESHDGDEVECSIGNVLAEGESDDEELPENFDESVDQFAELPENFDESVDQFAELPENFDESVDQFVDEQDEEEARSRAQEEDFIEPLQISSDKHEAQSSKGLNPPGRINKRLNSRKRNREDMDQSSRCLSPAERIIKRLDSRKKNDKDMDQSSRCLSPAERIIKRLDSRKRNDKDMAQSSRSLSPAERIIKRLKLREKNRRFLNNGSSSADAHWGGSAVNDDMHAHGLDSSEISPTRNRNWEIGEGHPRFSTEHGRSSTFHGSAAYFLESPRDSGIPDVVCPAAPPLTNLCVQKVVKKRGYRFNKRRKASSKPISSRKQRRLELFRKSFEENPFESLEECCGSECYTLVNPDYAVAQYRRFLRMDRTDRKRAVATMYNRGEKRFWFDGSPVCSRFVVSLSFSNQLQSAVKGTGKARASASIVACPRDTRRDTKKNKIILFIRYLAGAIGDSLPTRNHSNLPLLAKSQVYSRFLKIAATPGEGYPSRSYFYSVWKSYCKHIKTHRRHGFTVCSMCEKLRASLAECENEQVQATIRRNMDEHYDLMQEERRGYAARIELTKKFPGKYLSLIVDGADQKSYGLPHFLFDTKDDQGHKFKVKCVGVLEHGLHKHLSLFTMTEEFQSGANHVLEAIHRVLGKKKSESGRLPEVLFVQADNCTRENKNHFFMAYFQLLVALGVFREVQISFLPIGHTHADIDQAFSTVATRLSLFDAITMEGMLEELNNCYTPRASAEAMDNVANFSGLCQESRCLLKVRGFSQYRYFRFTRKKQSDSSDNITSAASGTVNNSNTSGTPFQTTCDVKIQSQEEWSPMDNSKHRRGFLKFIPDLRKTPATDTNPPDNVLEVNKHLQSCEGRIKTEENMRSLKALRDKVYTRRVDDFHWSVETAFELHGDYQEVGDAGDMIGAAELYENSYNVERVGYSLNSFLAVKTDAKDDHPFWVARTLRVDTRNDDGHAIQLKVRWYQLRKESHEPFSGCYEMSSYLSGKQRKFYDDVVDVRSVLCQFESLTQKGGLHIRTQKAIRQCLNMN